MLKMMISLHSINTTMIVYKQQHNIIRRLWIFCNSQKIGFNGETLTLVVCGNSMKEEFFVAIYLEDNLIVGHPEVIEVTIEHFKMNGLVCGKNVEFLRESQTPWTQSLGIS
ncbi:hypothetical protein ACHAXS_011475 [Conticribra weissflogii]